jgi:PAS domain S-box-containing protein
MKKTRPPRNTRRELKRLRARLAEAEQTLDAIRSGEVDALMVEGPEGPKFFTLQTPDQPYRLLVERMNEGAASLSAEGIIIFCNQRLAGMVGYPAERLVGSSMGALVTGVDRDLFQKLLVRGLEGESREEMQLQRNDRSLVPVQLSLNVIPGELPRKLCLVATELTERKEAEAAQRRQASQYATLISTTSEGYCRLDLEGRLLEVNDTYCRMSGYSRNELLNMHFADLEAIEEPLDVRRHIQQIVFTGFDHFESQHRRKNEEIFDVEISASYCPVAGHCLLFARDITSRKRAEQQIRRLNEELEDRVLTRTEELEDVNKELEAFNYAVAHDLRAPLRHMSGFTDLLAAESGPALNDSSRGYLEAVRDSVRHMGQLLEDLLRLSRLGRQEMHKGARDVNRLVADTVEGLKPEIKNRDVEWRIATLPLMECDPVLMQQVLINLLSNAVKFTRPREHAIIEIGQTTINGWPVLFVRDNGVGFNMKYVDKVFGVFQRLHRQSEFEGTGVGLAIVQRIIHRHGGRVWAEAELDKGATFYVSLPSGKE